MSPDLSVVAEAKADVTLEGSRPPRVKKQLVRRSRQDHSQAIRHSFQFAFIVLNILICTKFYLWVRYFENGGTGRFIERPAGVEGWLPIAGLMNTKYFFATGHVPALHAAAMFLFLGFVAMSLLLKKAFCSWLCPVGTVSEYLWKFGKKLLKTNLELPRWIDVPLHGLKYLLLGFFGVVIVKMSAESIADFMQSPYGVVADVKMLNFFRHIGQTGMIVILVLVVLSVVIKNFWCRYLCPYGALMGLVSLVSPVKIRRDKDACIDCAKCAKACPSDLPVHKLVQISSAECTGCMSCVTACPAESALQFSLMPRKTEASETVFDIQIAGRWRNRIVRSAAVGTLVALIFLGMVGMARLTGNWKSRVPREVYMELVPRADEASHPGM